MRTLHTLLGSKRSKLSIIIIVVVVVVVISTPSSSPVGVARWSPFHIDGSLYSTQFRLPVMNTLISRHTLSSSRPRLRTHKYHMMCYIRERVLCCELQLQLRPACAHTSIIYCNIEKRSLCACCVHRIESRTTRPSARVYRGKCARSRTEQII